jgi:hypothetical protein
VRDLLHCYHAITYLLLNVNPICFCPPALSPFFHVLLCFFVGQPDSNPPHMQNHSDRTTVTLTCAVGWQQHALSRDSIHAATASGAVSGL